MYSCIINGRLLVDNAIIDGKVLIFDSKIVDIVDERDLDSQTLKNMTIIDAKGHFVSAGFIDIHIHGSGGVDVMDASRESLDILSNTLPKTGTTSILATTMTMSNSHILNALENIKEHGNKVKGTNILGIHLEGPFINKRKHGAQDKNEIQPPSLKLVEPYLHLIKMITLAPEIDGAKEFILYLKKHYPDIILSIGHSDANYTLTKESIKWGISHATHLFNAMNPYHHREPSIVGAVFDTDITCDIIADLVHTHPSTLDLTYKLKKEKLILITDAMRAGCMKSGSYDLGGRSVEVTDKQALLDDGTLAGSVLKMNEALLNMTTHTQMNIATAVKSVTSTVADKLSLNKGYLAKDYDADITIFDKYFDIQLTIVSGKTVFFRRDKK